MENKNNDNIHSIKIVLFLDRLETNMGRFLIDWYISGKKPEKDDFIRTIGSDVQKKKIILDGNQQANLIFLSLSGQMRYRETRGIFYKGGDASIIIYTLLNPSQGYNYVTNRLTEIQKFTGNIPILVIGTDIEKVDSKNSIAERDSIKEFVERSGNIYLETNSDTIDSVKKSIKELIGRVLEKKIREEADFNDPNELEVIKNIEESIGRTIPRLSVDKEEYFGYKLENNHITELYLQNLRLKQLTEKIGNLKYLKILDLEKNQLISLPPSIKNIKSLVLLNLENNKLTNIPPEFWPLDNLRLLQLRDNPWKGESKDYFDKTPSVIRDFCRKRANIHVFISHAVIDFEKFKIKEISEFLGNKEEIYKAYYCEEDLKGNIDDFMNYTIPQCQLLLFVATNNSVFNSNDCIHEIELAKKHNIQIIPIKGNGINWEDLTKIGLSRELGMEFNSENFNNFCQNLYQYIYDFKRKIDLIDKEKGQVDKIVIDLLNIFDENLKAETIRNNIEKNFSRIEELRTRLYNEKISFKKFTKKLSQYV